MITAPAELALEQPSAQQSTQTLPLAARPAWWQLSQSACITLAVGLLVTAALAITALVVYNRNEQRLLDLRARELGLVLQSAQPSVQTPLTSAAALVGATGGSPGAFRAFMTPLVGPGRQFISASLWRLSGSAPSAETIVGAAPALASRPGVARSLFAGARRPGVLYLTGLLGSSHPSLGYGVLVAQPHRMLAVYAESPLPANRRSRLESNSAFADLDYALYLGRARSSSALLVTSLKHLPIRGRSASSTVPFGASALTLVVSPRGSLGGTFFMDLPWIIAGLGMLLAGAAALLTESLARGRKRAEGLAGVLDRVADENRRMYAEQRSISQTLQHALLPDRLPELRGLALDALYVPAASGVDVGGDWYDVVAIDERQVVMVIGDVSGHGLRAATTMALVRHAALAYVAQDPRPATVLTKLSGFVNRSEHDYFATVLCMLIDVERRRITVASAGHMAPLLLDGAGGEFLELQPDAPIGVPWAKGYQESEHAMPPEATLIAFTDGLVERRGESLDVGLARLREAAGAQPRGLHELLASLARELASGELHDDTAMVGIQWQS